MKSVCDVSKRMTNGVGALMAREMERATNMKPNINGGCLDNNKYLHGNVCMYVRTYVCVYVCMQYVIRELTSLFNFLEHLSNPPTGSL